MMDNMGTFGWGPGFGWVFMILFWALIILGLFAIAKWLTGTSGSSGSTPPKSARQILDERYARGEINQEEYEQKKRDLQA